MATVGHLVSAAEEIRDAATWFINTIDPHDRTLTVNVFVEGGVAHITSKPAGIRVVIQDIDPEAIGEEVELITSGPDEYIIGGEPFSTSKGSRAPASHLQDLTNRLGLLDSLLREALDAVEADEQPRAESWPGENLKLDLARHIRQALKTKTE